MRLRFLILLAALAVAAPASAAAPKVDARAYLVQNTATGDVLLRHNDRQRVPVASITKLMTVLVALEHAKLDDEVTVDPAAPTGGSSIYLQAGERIRVRDLVEAALIQSANDAANALALHVGRGSMPAFVQLMNRRARALGLTETRYVNATGLDAPGHVSSARDVTRLARIAMREPVLRRIVREPRAVIAGGRALHTWNDLLATTPTVFGVKTGHTNAAGWSQVAAARAGGVTVYATLLGSPTRAERNDDLRRLIAWGLSRYESVRVVDEARVYAHAETQYGRKPVALTASRSILRIVRVDRPLLERVVAPAVVALPVRKGQELGHVSVYAGKRLVARAPLLATRSVERPGVLSRARWYAGEAVSNAWGWLT